MGLILFALFLGIPLAEIALFVVIGERIGVLATIAIVILTAIAGAALVRHQGFGTLEKARRDMEQDRIPTGAMAEGLAILIAGALLLTPGFLTDAIGFTLLIPPARQKIVGWIGRWLASRVTVVSMDAGMGSGMGGGAGRKGPKQGPGYEPRGSSGNGVIDGEAVEIDPDAQGLEGPPSGPPNPESPWRKT